MIETLAVLARLFALAGLIAASAVFWADVHAAEPPDVTMTVVGSDEVDENTMMQTIQLPDAASLKAAESAAPGHDTANQARELGREFGQQRAQEARERARGKDNGRPDTPPGRPVSPPGRPDSPPGRPDSPPGRPDSPPGRPDSPSGLPDPPPG